MYQIVFAKQAAKTLRKVPQNVARLIRKKLEDIASDPHAQHNNVTKLRNRSGYRLRVGDWRVIYEIEDERMVIHVLEVGSRGGVYVNERADY